MWRADNWGWRARFGILIVGDDVVPEAEWWAMAPAGVSIHAARVASGGFRAGGAVSDSTRAFEGASDLERGCELFGKMRLDAIVLGHSSSSFNGGKGWDEATIERLRPLLGAIPMTTNGLDCLAALNAVGSTQPFLVLPPWYNDDVVAGALRYLSDWGFEPAAHHRLDPGRGWNELPPNEIYRQGNNAAQDPERLYQQARRTCPKDADAVLIVGTGFRTAAVIEALEEDLDRPVLTANQVSLWRCLQIAGVRAPVEGYGRLFRER